MKKDRRKYIKWLLVLVIFLFPSLSLASLPAAPSSFYLDELGMLDEATKRNITQTNRELEQKTGSQVVVATIDNTDGLPASDLGPRLINQWGIGSKEKRNGAIILITEDKTTDRREVFIATGYGIEGRLNDGKVGRIIDNYMLDDLKAGNYSHAINEGFNSVVAEIADEYGVKLDGSYDAYLNNNAAEGGLNLFSIIMIIMVFIMISNAFTRASVYTSPSRRYYRRYYGNPYSRGYTYDPFSNPSSGYSPNSRSRSSSSSSSWSSSSGGFTGGGGSSGGGGAGRSF